MARSSTDLNYCEQAFVVISVDDHFFIRQASRAFAMAWAAA